jgi:hypothetical protein
MIVSPDQDSVIRRLVQVLLELTTNVLRMHGFTRDLPAMSVMPSTQPPKSTFTLGRSTRLLTPPNRKMRVNDVEIVYADIGASRTGRTDHPGTLVMKDTGLILQYASAEPSGRLCLPTDCSLYIQKTDTGIRVLAAIKVRKGAIGGMVFACLVLLLYSAFLVPEMMHAIRTRSTQYIPDCLACFCAAYAGLLVFVANNTWRWTALDVSPESLKLTLWSFFSRRSIVWDGAALHDVAVDRVWVVGRPGPHGQLRLALLNKAPVLLFAGHDMAMLESAAAQIRAILLHPHGGAGTQS